jgi:8-oxo-dGTP diphosphatase
VKLCGVTNDIFLKEKKHYITIFVVCELQDEKKEPEVMEKEKCESWNWISWEQLQRVSPTFIPLENYLKENKTAPK